MIQNHFLFEMFGRSSKVCAGTFNSTLVFIDFDSSWRISYYFLKLSIDISRHFVHGATDG